MQSTRVERAGGAMPLPAGMVLERYRIEHVIAAGGFGITYYCHHVGLESAVAIKEHFPRQFAFRDGHSSDVRPTDPEIFTWALDRFLQEGKSLAKCRHPNVVTVTDVFEANGTAYMVLGYEKGHSLKRWLEELKRPPTQQELDHLLGPLLDALSYVHAQGLLHRDIAPDNIMIRMDGAPCLIDFGAARQAVAERSQMMSAIVKSGYSPQEQYTTTGRAQGPWSDIYAVGATLYRALTGVPPQEAPDRQISDEVKPLVTSLQSAAAYRPTFLTAVDAALRLHHGQRPQNVGEWRESLFSGLGEERRTSLLTARVSMAHVLTERPEPESARPVTFSTLPGPPPQVEPRNQPVWWRRPLAAVAAGTILIGIAGAALWPIWQERMANASLRQEIAVAVTADGLSEIARRAPHLISEIAKRRQQLAAAARDQRLSILRDEVKQTTSQPRLDAILSEAPELRGDVERRKADLATAQKAERQRTLRERIATSNSLAELDQLASAEPDLRADIEARKLELVRSARAARVATARQQIADARSPDVLQAIAAELPELAADVERRRAALADEVAAQRREDLAGARRRLPEIVELSELDRLAVSYPELASEISSRRRAVEDFLQRYPARGIAPGSGQSFRDCPSCPELVVVPAGRFTMGSPATEAGRYNDEGPTRVVTIPQPLAVGKYEVTFAEWKACVDGGGCASNRDPGDQGWGRGRRPVINVSWNDAKEYVTWLSRTTGRRYRLLSEAEWEYAARAGTQTAYSWGPAIGRGNANCAGCGSQWDSRQTAEVGSFRGNAWGLHDMHGNAYEWVEDCWHYGYNGAPSDGSARTKACTDNSRRVVRGGSWFNNPKFLRSAIRYGDPSGLRSYGLSFRLARTLNP